MNKSYISDEAKKKFSIITGILGVIFFMAQFIVPFIFMIPFMFYMFSTIENLTDYNLSHAVHYNSGILVKAETANKKYNVVEITPGKVTTLFHCNKYPWLVNYDDQVWCFTENIVRRYKNNKWRLVRQYHKIIKLMIKLSALITKNIPLEEMIQNFTVARA